MPETDPRLSTQQARPLDVRGASVALSAGAGCGKTTVLTARFLSDLDGPEARPTSAQVILQTTLFPRDSTGPGPHRTAVRRTPPGRQRSVDLTDFGPIDEPAPPAQRDNSRLASSAKE